jgi:hypothetical protein
VVPAKWQDRKLWLRQLPVLVLVCGLGAAATTSLHLAAVRRETEDVRAVFKAGSDDRHQSLLTEAESIATGG